MSAAPVPGGPGEVPRWTEGGALDLVRCLPGLDGDDLADDCATAIDPLEIAARLESAGVSNAVVRNAVARPDVFALANELYSEVPARPGGGPAGRRLRRGGPPDLVRGAGFAVPTLLFIVAIEGLHLHPSWWMLPFTLIIGWAFGQGTTSVLYLLREGGAPGDELAVAGWLPIGAAVVAGGGAFAAVVMFGGGFLDVAASGMLVGYTVAVGVLYTLHEARLVLPALGPGVVGALLLPWHRYPNVSRSVAGWGAVISISVTIALASRHLAVTHGMAGRLRRAGLGDVAQRALAGACTGAVVGLIVVSGHHATAPGGGGVFASLPLILTLGVMEWQFRSFRWRAVSLSNSSSEVGEFARRVWRMFLHSLAAYLATVSVLTAAVAVVVVAAYTAVPMTLLGAQLVLAVAYFTGLVVASCSRGDLLLVAWSASLITALLWVGGGWVLSGRVSAPLMCSAALVGAAAAASSLVVFARSVVRTPLSY